MERPTIRLNATVLGARDPRLLAAFYSRMLGWEIHTDEPDWVTLWDPEGGAGLSFQLEEAHVAPRWPAGPGDQQMMMHLDVLVGDLDEGQSWALTCGATLAGFQPQDDVRVMIDPEGHLFCLFED